MGQARQRWGNCSSMYYVRVLLVFVVIVSECLRSTFTRTFPRLDGKERGFVDIFKIPCFRRELTQSPHKYLSYVRIVVDFFPIRKRKGWYRTGKLGGGRHSWRGALTRLTRPAPDAPAGDGRGAGGDWGEGCGSGSVGRWSPRSVPSAAA